MTTWVRPVTGWIARDGVVPGPDVDEFAGPDQVRAALAVFGDASSLLAVQHPHRTPRAAAAGHDLAGALPGARAELSSLQQDFYTRVQDVLLPYRVTGPDGTAVGVLCLVDPAVAGPDGHSRVGHSEEVYPEVVAERAAVLAGLGVATSAALLAPVMRGDALTPAVEQVVAERGEPVVQVTDVHGRTHELWLVGPGPEQDLLVKELETHPLLVADGNHRVAAAAAAGGHWMLAMVTSGPDLRIGSIHRAITGTGLDSDGVLAALRRTGLDVREDVPAVAPEPGEVVVVTPERAFGVRLPEPSADEPRPRIDHAVVEELLAEAFGVDPAGPSVRPLPAAELPAEGLPAGADAVILIAPVPTHDVVDVHQQRRRMPRKSTYFTPKPRSGMVLAELR